MDFSRFRYKDAASLGGGALAVHADSITLDSVDFVNSTVVSGDIASVDMNEGSNGPDTQYDIVTKLGGGVAFLNASNYINVTRTTSHTTNLTYFFDTRPGSVFFLPATGGALFEFAGPALVVVENCTFEHVSMRTDRVLVNGGVFSAVSARRTNFTDVIVRDASVFVSYDIVLGAFLSLNVHAEFYGVLMEGLALRVVIPPNMRGNLYSPFFTEAGLVLSEELRLSNITIRNLHFDIEGDLLGAFAVFGDSTTVDSDKIPACSGADKLRAPFAIDQLALQNVTILMRDEQRQPTGVFHLARRCLSLRVILFSFFHFVFYF